MRRLAVLGAALLALACPRPSAAQVTGQYTGAVPLAVDHRMAGAYVGLSGDMLQALGQLRLSYYPGFDFGFQGGFMHLDADHGHTCVVIGGDAKARIATHGPSQPFDIAAGGAIDLANASGYNLLGVGPLVVASHPARLHGAALTPYAGLALMFNRLDVGSFSNTDASLQLRLGTEYELNPDVRFVLELQFGASDPVGSGPKFILGTNLPF